LMDTPETIPFIPWERLRCIRLKKSNQNNFSQIIILAFFESIVELAEINLI